MKCPKCGEDMAWFQDCGFAGRNGAWHYCADCDRPTYVPTNTVIETFDRYKREKEEKRDEN